MPTRTFEGLWACPACHTVIATSSATYPPGKKQGGPRMKCPPCDQVLEPDEWVRVNL